MPTCLCLSARPRRQRRCRPPSDIAKRSDVDWYRRTRAAYRGFGGETRLKRKAEFTRLAALLGTAVILAALLGCKSQVSDDVMATGVGRKIFGSAADKYSKFSVASAPHAPAGEHATILRLNILRQLTDDEMVMR